MTKVSDYVMKRLADSGIRQAFVVTGGGAMHLNDSLVREKRLRYVCNHHEQAAAMAAEGYARITGIPALVSVTTGPGGINALNGVFGAWADSVAMLVISGQVKRETFKSTAGCQALRQLGDQEVEIIPMVRGITKYAALVPEPESIRYHLERAMFLATSGRPGPCWLDIPIDVQGAQVDETVLCPYDPAEDNLAWDGARVESDCREVIARIKTAKRPVIMAGTGVRLARALGEFEAVIRALEIPVTTEIGRAHV